MIRLVPSPRSSSTSASASDGVPPRKTARPPLARSCADVGECGRDRIEAPAAQVQPGERPDAVPDEGADQALGRFEGVSRRAEHPLRPGEFGVHRRERLDRAVPLAIEVPPAAPVGDEDEIAVRRPFRLDDRFVGSAGDGARVSDRAVGAGSRRPRARSRPTACSDGSRSSQARRPPSGLRRGEE